MRGSSSDESSSDVEEEEVDDGGGYKKRQEETSTFKPRLSVFHSRSGVYLCAIWGTGLILRFSLKLNIYNII